MSEEDHDRVDVGGAQRPLQKECEKNDNIRQSPYDDDDENDTVDQVRRRTSDYHDEPMMTARLVESSSRLVAPRETGNNPHDDDSHSRSFASCDTHDHLNMINILTDNSSTLDLDCGHTENNKMINILADSDVDLNSSENDGCAGENASTSTSEYSESMDFPSFNRFKGGEREPQSERPEGAPRKQDSTSGDSPSDHVPKVRRVSRAERSGRNLSTEAGPPQLSPLRASAPSKSEALVKSEADLEYGRLSPVRASTGGGSLLFKGKPSAASRFRPSLRRTLSFGRAHTAEGIPERKSFLEQAKLEQFAIDLDGEVVTENLKFKRKLRSRSMDMAGSFYSADSFIPRNNTVTNSNRMSVAFGASREQSNYQPVVIRRSKKMDILTGGEMDRDVLCQRIIDYPEAMDPNERRRKMVVRTKKEDANHRSMHGAIYEPQYRLQTRVHAQHRFHKEQMQSETADPGLLTRYLIWSLRSNFVIVLVSQAFAFWATICIFTVCIYAAGLYQPQCIEGPHDLSFDESGAYFIDAYALSWTTFATVGYGIVHPQVRSEPHENSYRCAFMTTLTALESFVGVLFASFCGAVIVGKMARARSTAAVQFSLRTVLRFGTGVIGTDDDDDRCSDEREKPISKYDRRRLFYPCPVLEFRVANALFDNATGEITNAKLNVVSSTLDDTNKRDSAKRHSVISGLPSGIARPGFEAFKGMTHSASQFLFRPNSSGASASDTPPAPPVDNQMTMTNNLFLAAQLEQQASIHSTSMQPPKTNKANKQRSFSTPVSQLSAHETELKDSKHSLNSSFGTLRNNFWHAPTSLIRGGSWHSGLDNLERDAKPKVKSSVLKKLSKVGKDAIEGVVIKKRLMRSTNQPMQDESMMENQPLKDESESSSVKNRRNAICVEEDPTGGLVPRKLFSSLDVECSKHPFFKRVWTIRHVLNCDSPLLSERARQIIKESSGRWPREICNSHFIRKHVEFQQLIVSLSGTTCGNNVYGIHVYDYQNLHVGYTFSPMIRCSPEGRLLVDIDSIDNIQEQRGGGAEPIDYYDMSDIAIRRYKLAAARDEELMGESSRRIIQFQSDRTSSDMARCMDEIDEVDESLVSEAIKPIPVAGGATELLAKRKISFRRGLPPSE